MALALLVVFAIAAVSTAASGTKVLTDLQVDLPVERRWLSPIGTFTVVLTSTISVATVIVTWLMMMNVGLRASSIVAVISMIGIAGFGAWRRRPDSILPLLAEEWRRAPVTITLLILVVIGVIAYVILVVARAGDYSWDSWGYHFAINHSMLQEDGFYHLPELIKWMHYPAGFELQGSLVGLATGSVKAFSLVQLPYAMGMGTVVATTLAGRKGEWGGLAGIGSVFAIPAVWTQLATGYVDVAVAAIVLMAIVTLFAAYQTMSVWFLAPSALLIGMVPATKLLGAPGVVAGALLVVSLLLTSINWRQRVLIMALLAIPATPFLLRNYVEDGNPFYPVAFGPWEDAKGISIDQMRADTDGEQRPDEWVGLGFTEVMTESMIVSPLEAWFPDGPDDIYLFAYDARHGGLGILWPFVIFGGLVGLVAARIRKDESLRSAGWMLVVGFLTLLIIPAAWWPRFALPAGVVMLLASLVLISRRALPVVAVVALAVGGCVVVKAESVRRSPEGDFGVKDVLANYDTAKLDIEERIVIGDGLLLPGALWGDRVGNSVSLAESVDEALVNDPDALILVQKETLGPNIPETHTAVEFQEPYVSTRWVWLIPSN